MRPLGLDGRKVGLRVVKNDLLWEPTTHRVESECADHHARRTPKSDKFKISFILKLYHLWNFFCGNYRIYFSWTCNDNDIEKPSNEKLLAVKDFLANRPEEQTKLEMLFKSWQLALRSTPRTRRTHNFVNVCNVHVRMLKEHLEYYCLHCANVGKLIPTNNRKFS